MKNLLLALPFLALGSLHATPLFTCPASLATCDGNEYAVTELSNIGNTYQLELDIHVLDTYTGDQFTDFVNSVQLKDFASGTITNATLISAPGGLSLWNPLSPNELDASGCDGGSGGAFRLCEQAQSPSLGMAFSSGDTLTWIFQFDTTGSLLDTAHLKYLYVDSDGDKVGSLGSFDIGIQIMTPGGPGGSPTVPEPVTFTLVGAGLIGVVLYRRSVGRAR